ncbi:hypothetical protein BDZ97DRAFT_1920250 [Flammula alnicola]|nr:hypothetical protein BDZ97DRAFT_1920250 [Flammula alnicola]
MPTENWDNGFEDVRNSPKKHISTPHRQREESWDDDLDDDQDDSAEFGLFMEKEEDRAVTARSCRAVIFHFSSTPSPLPPQPPSLPLPFLMNQPPSMASYLAQDQHFPQWSPTSSVFSVPNTVNTYSSTVQLCPTSAFALLPPSPPVHKECEHCWLRKQELHRTVLSCVPGVSVSVRQSSFSRSWTSQQQVRPVSTAMGGLSTMMTSPGTTWSKLIRQKSLGFVQLRRGFGGHGGVG